MVSIAPVIAAGGNYRNTSDASTRNLPLSTLVKPDGSAYTIADGDCLLLWIFYGGATTTNTVSGLTGLNKVADNVGSNTSTLYVKQNCVAADATATLAIATSAANRTCAIVVILKNVPVTGPWNHGYAVNSAASSPNGSTPSLTPTDIGGIALQCAIWTGNNTPTDVPHPDGSAGLTEIRTENNSGTIPNHVGSMANFGASGTAAGNVGYSATPLATTAPVGGANWTPFTQAPNGSKNAWTIVIAPTIVSATNKPTSIISSTGYSNVGGTANILASLGDDLDTTFAETSDDPVSLTLEAKFPLTAAQNKIGLRYKLQSAQTGAVTYVASIYCGATLICTETVVVAVADGVIPRQLLSSTAQAATITDWSDLRGRVVSTKV